MPDSEAKKAWIKENSKIVSFKCMKKGDADILAFLQGKQTATVIKAALREYMERHGNE